MKKHVQILAVLNIAWGAMGFIGALVVMLIFGGALGVVGMVVGDEPDAGMAVPILAFVGGAISLLLLVTSVPAIAAGIGLLRAAPWARLLAIIVSALHLFAFPIGTALGIYGLWVLFSDKSASYFADTRPPLRL